VFVLAGEYNQLGVFFFPPPSAMAHVPHPLAKGAKALSRQAFMAQRTLRRAPATRSPDAHRTA
jgi:hypothetical protein